VAGPCAWLISPRSPGEARALIAHEGGLRRQVVTAVTPGHAVADVVRAAQARLPAMCACRPACSCHGRVHSRRCGSGARQLLAHVALAGVAMVALLVLAFGGVRPALLILAGMPPAMAGGVLAVALTGGTVSLGALVGFIALFGISARNAILLVAHVDQLVLGKGAHGRSTPCSSHARARHADPARPWSPPLPCCRWRSRPGRRGARSRGRWPW
jgi:Cu/Ag efflux pump CusA